MNLSYFDTVFPYAGGPDLQIRLFTVLSLNDNGYRSGQ